ncbi:uncharacterized protein LOC134647231 [Cydia amplana]|uniref:uncharacterized protein LOC134647231 n=1 Tax=Cydia amplana TaxID=1869771 RepID=UPI002FE5526D
MSSRGRGYGGYSGRGSYSGRASSGYRGSYRGSGGRGSYESRGGRGGGYSYNNESRYSSSGGNRYAPNRDRIEDSYKKSYRSESTGYSNRDYGGRSGSPERKRIRMEGSGDRRSHEGGGHYGGSYSGRQEMYSERRTFGGEDRRRSPSREYRKPSAMGPPREPTRSAPRMRASRRSFRGRTLRSRALYRGAPRSRPSYRRFETRPLGYTRAFRSIKGRSSVKSKEDEASSTEEDWDADDKDEAIEDKKESKIKSPKAEDDVDGSDGASEAGEPVDDGDTDKEPDLPGAEPRKRPYVHLLCVHCKDKSATFGGYAKHLMSSKHRAAMSAVARRHKMQLLRMRVAQREAQRSLEATAGADLAAHTTFCLVCRLNHRTTRLAHNQSDTHRAMKRFLMPFCRVCRLSFRSPMIYEHHICSLDHLKIKANRTIRRASPKEAQEGSGEEGMDVDLDNFMTLDSVGDVDEVEDEDSGTEKKDSEAPKKPKVEINIGSDHIKKLEVWWCELCRVYLPRAEPGGAEEAETLRRHCRLRNHLGRYVQHRDTRTLRKHAERIHRQLHQQRAEENKEANEDDAAEKVKIEKTEPAEEKKIENGDSVNATGEDKLWADVDKDIGDLLRDVRPTNEGSDDDEDLTRYDKFRKSDKKGKADGEETETTVAESLEKPTNEVTTPA